MEQLNEGTHAEKIQLIQKWIDSGEQVPAHDVLWLLDNLKESERKLSELEKSLSEIKAYTSKAVASNNTLRNNLTLWLAVRGSNTEEFFAATKALAAQTSKALNETSH